jgi:hypothetical protein
MKISHYDEIQDAVLDARRLSEVRKIMLVDALSDMIADNRQLRLDGYVYQAGEPDLRVVAGRAEWFIDQVMLLPRESQNSRRTMNERIELWKAGTASRRALSPEQGRTLKAKYAGKIQTGVGVNAIESLRNLENFLDEWIPYGKSVEEMERILDLKLPVRGSEAVLLIDSGRGGWEYRFIHEQGTIRTVKRKSIN